MSQAGATQEITLAIGDPIPWAPAPGGLAQVDELLRSNVVLYYRARSGRIRRPKIAASRVANLIASDARAGSAHHSPILPIPNPLGRAARNRFKSYRIR